MSQIATFYTFDKNIEALLEAAVPQRKISEKKILFFTRKTEQTVDIFWNFIKEHGQAQENYPYSGTGFTDLELLLEEKGINLFQFGAKEFAEKLAAARPEVVAVFDQAAATATITMLNELTLTEAEARKYSNENFPPEEEEALAAESIISAYEIFKRWLGSVGESQLGLLIIG